MDGVGGLDPIGARRLARWCLSNSDHFWYGNFLEWGSYYIHTGRMLQLSHLVLISHSHENEKIHK